MTPPPASQAVFALRTGAPVFLGLCLAVPGEPGRYRCELEEVRFEPSGELEEDVRRLTAAHAAALAERVRREPEQYFWQHRRWKRQPADTPDHLRDPVAGPIDPRLEPPEDP